MAVSKHRKKTPKKKTSGTVPAIPPSTEQPMAIIPNSANAPSGINANHISSVYLNDNVRLFFADKLGAQLNHFHTHIVLDWNCALQLAQQITAGYMTVQEGKKEVARAEKRAANAAARRTNRKAKKGRK